MKINTKTVGIVIVDDHEAMRQGLKALLLSEPGFEVIGEAENGKRAVELAKKLSPDIMVMDVNLGETSGIDVTRQILSNSPEIRVIGLSMHENEQVTESMYQAGAVDYISKSMSPQKLIDAVHNCMSEE